MLLDRQLVKMVKLKSNDIYCSKGFGEQEPISEIFVAEKRKSS
jgi:hypothetical protein